MRMMIVAASAAALGLAACNQEEEAPAMDETARMNVARRRKKYLENGPDMR